MTRTASCLALLLSVGCYRPDLSNTVFRCTAESPQCPEAHACIDGFCRPTGQQTDQGSGDGGASQTDMKSGCSSGTGFAVGRAYACPGTFAMGGAATLCASGWTPCTSATGIDLTACSQLSGFFLADVLGRRKLEAAADSICGAPTTTQNVLAIYGCGQLKQGIHKANNVCQGFDRLNDCVETSIKCYPMIGKPADSLSKVENLAAGDGVVCCPM